jgi:6-phosphogluconolactonase (cycloisomerase 2 family)
MASTPDGKFFYTTASVGAAAFRVDPASGALQHINTVRLEQFRTWANCSEWM